MPGKAVTIKNNDYFYRIFKKTYTFAAWKKRNANYQSSFRYITQLPFWKVALTVCAGRLVMISRLF